MAAAAILFLPASIINQLGLIKIQTNYRTDFGVALIASVALIVVESSSVLCSGLSAFIYESKLRRSARKKLMELTAREKEVMRHFIARDTNTINAELSDGVVRGLEGKGLIARAASISGMGGRLPFNLQPYVRREMLKRPELIGHEAGYNPDKKS